MFSASPVPKDEYLASPLQSFTLFSYDSIMTQAQVLERLGSNLDLTSK